MTARDLEDAVASLERLAQAGQRPSHYVGRHVLLTLGLALRTESPEACAPWLARIRTAGESCAPAWGEAVQDELTLACGEFAQCLDPRYLDLPGYDVEYTAAARLRLEDRLRAAQALGFAPTPREAEVLELADRVWATLEKRRDAGTGERPDGSGAQSRRGSGPEATHKRRRK